eukprot:377954-Amphidinium_carterae.1
MLPEVILLLEPFRHQFSPNWRFHADVSEIATCGQFGYKQNHCMFFRVSSLALGTGTILQWNLQVLTLSVSNRRIELEQQTTTLPSSLCGVPGKECHAVVFSKMLMGLGTALRLYYCRRYLISWCKVQHQAATAGSVPRMPAGSGHTENQ